MVYPLRQHVPWNHHLYLEQFDGLQCVSCDEIMCCRMFLMFLDDDDNIIGVAAAYPLRNVDTITDRCLSCKKEKQNNISRRAKRRKKNLKSFH